MNLELKEFRDNLIFQKEYNLNTKPLEIDLLIIKKQTAVPISNDIGQFFRGHNILEFKSPEDHFNVDVLYKSEAYAALYKSYGHTVDAVKADDITVSIFREAKPKKLFKHLEKQGNRIFSCHNGIYYIQGPAAWFPTQIIVTKELGQRAHSWLRGLSCSLDQEDLLILLESARRMTEKFDIELADSVLNVSIGANRNVIQKLIGDEYMFEALMEIMEPKIIETMKPKIIEAMGPKMEEVREAGLREGLREGRILGTVETLRNIQYSDADIKLTIIRQYGLTDTEADEYLRST